MWPHMGQYLHFRILNIALNLQPANSLPVSAKAPVGGRLLGRRRTCGLCDQELLEVAAQAVGIHEFPPEVPGGYKWGLL